MCLRTLRATVIVDQRYDDDFTVIWRELSRHPVHGSAGDAEPHRVSHYAQQEAAPIIRSASN